MPPEQPEIDGNAADTTSTCTSTSAIASATHNNNNDNNVIVGPDLNDTKSPFDKKLYRQILLPNGLRAVLVCDTVAMAQAHNEGGLHHGDDDDDDDDDDEYSNDNEEEDDKDTESSDDSEADNEHHGGHHSEHGGLREAAAAMVVGVGSMYDPPECQGMAHFLEHLLFMGSKKYPLENAYDSFMSKHGGSDNAFTELEHTVYHFEIPQEHLAGALDMFAQFFTSPLLLDSSVERELQSIESEFQLVKNSDNCRVNQLVCHTSGNDPKDHPFAKFSWGNIQSLKVCYSLIYIYLCMDRLLLVHH
jgi:nardilysin